jgi:hypothetical protein
MVPQIFIVGADKGGVGKTMLSRLLLSYLEKRHDLVTRAFDCQFPKGILKRFHPRQTEIIDIFKSDDHLKIFDTLKPDQVTVIDLAAGQLAYMLGLVGELGFLDNVKRGLLGITVLHVIGSTQASFDEIKIVSKMVEGARHFLVTNRINDAGYLGLSPELTALAAGVINVQQLNPLAAEHVDRAGASFSDFMADEGHSLTLRRYVTAWQPKAFAEFDAVRLLATS